MGSPRFPYGFHMDALGLPYGSPRNSLWIPYGFPVDSLRCLKNSVWNRKEFLLEAVCVPYGFPVDSLGIPSGFLVSHRGTHRESLRHPQGIRGEPTRNP